MVIIPTQGHKSFLTSGTLIHFGFWRFFILFFFIIYRSFLHLFLRVLNIFTFYTSIVCVKIALFTVKGPPHATFAANITIKSGNIIAPELSQEFIMFKVSWHTAIDDIRDVESNG